MSEIEKMICDNCKTISKDICGDPGWISINWASKDRITVSISGGRPEGKDHKSKFYKNSDKNVDFCCTQCMLEWMGLFTPIEPKGFINMKMSPEGSRL